MRNIKLALEYDGTAYSGWQSQKRGEATVQAALEEAVEKLTGRRPRVIGSGRTDAGVHALGQVACFRTASALGADVIKRGLNALLPPDIRVREAEEAEPGFHPQLSARGKRYFYVISNSERLSPFMERFAWRVPQRLAVPAMRTAAAFVVGRRDFSAFRASGSSARTSEREITRVAVSSARGLCFAGARLEGRFIRVTVEGDGFLRHMVRNIVGTLVDVGRGKIKPGDVPGIIASGDRKAAGPTAPARGLFLEKVFY
ncbi:MAG: tRNA pseudouridine(38-40) synthase TruA [Thermodesulfovibrionales bacterium]